MLPSPDSLTMHTCRALLAATVALSLGGIGRAQVIGPTGTTPDTFAPPWGVTFQHIQDAMRGNRGAYAVEQTRRENEGGQFVGTLEHLLYLPADPTNNTPERFRLDFLGIEGRPLSTVEFQQLLALFAGKSGYTFRYKGFHLADPARAASRYDLLFLATDRRATREGTVEVYRMAVVPKGWDRTAWLLELDTKTGYPLYAGEYSLEGGVTLRSELVVTSFRTGVRAPNAKDPSWWSPLKGITATSDELAALKQALTQSTAYVAPGLTELPGGFALAGSEVHIDPYHGTRLAVLRYTDGIDHVFVTENNVTKTPRAAEDTIAFLTQDGVTRCAFTHGGVSFDVVGRQNQVVRDLAVAMYSRAILVLK